MRIPTPAVVAVSLLAGGTAAAAAPPNCAFPAYSFATWENAVSPISMTVRSGKLCGLKLNSTETNRMESTYVSRRPVHGTAMVRGIHVDYRSRPGYVGDDRFSYVRVFRDRTGRQFISTIDLTITVVP